MKGVALEVCPHARLVDITHDVESFNIAHGALMLLLTYKYFPPGTVFVAVVDPGVGGPRRPVLVVSRNYFFVGPDNGLLVPAADEDGIERVYLIENELYFRKPLSRSFHGRDIFTPVAAWLTCGTPPDSFGRPLPPGDLKRIDLGLATSVVGGCAELRVAHVDKFGNVILSQPFRALSNALGLRLGERACVETPEGFFEAEVCEVFSVAREGALVLYENSFWMAELAVNKGSAAELMRVRAGETLRVCRCNKG